MKIHSCLEYLSSLADTNDNFLKLSQVKTESLINACGENPNIKNDSFLIIGYNLLPWGLSNSDVTVLDGFTNINSNYHNHETHDGELADFVAQGQTFDWVLAPDEWLTYAETEAEQQQKINLISKIARKGFFTTIKDYKNMFSNQRYFEEPFILRTNTGDAIVLRKREWDYVDKQRWIHRTFVIHNEELMCCPSYTRRTMYFKQLAKFSSDAGATSFCVEKKQMYKPIYSKSFEYVVCIKF